MKKKLIALAILFVLFIVLLCIAIGMGKGSNNKTEIPTETPIVLPTEEPTEESTEAPTEEPTMPATEPVAVVYPLPTTIELGNLQDCELAISIETGDVFQDDKMSEYTLMRATIWDYERFDLVDISTLKGGQTIVIDKKEVVIEALDTNEFGTVIINGGLDMGGYELVTNEDGVYYSIGYSDAKSWYEIGSALLEVSSDFVYVDSMSDDGTIRECTLKDFDIINESFE